MGYMQAPCSGTHSVVVGETEQGKHEVVTETLLETLLSAGQQPLLTRFAGTASVTRPQLLRGMVWKYISRGANQIHAGRTRGGRDRRRLRHSWVRWPSRQM